MVTLCISTTRTVMFTKAQITKERNKKKKVGNQEGTRVPKGMFF
jgi:hypothetical protein